MMVTAHGRIRITRRNQSFHRAALLSARHVRFGSLADICSAKGHVRTLPPIATAKADSRKRSYPLYLRKQTCAVQLEMSALGQKRTIGWLTINARFEDP